MRFDDPHHCIGAGQAPPPEQAPPPGFAPPTEMPREPELHEISRSLVGLEDYLSETLGRLCSGLDRAQGAEPKPERGGGEAAHPQSCGVVAEITRQLSVLHQMARGLANEAERLERLV